MSALTSLLVRDHVLSVRKVEMALEKQVTDGGDLENVLLEMDAVAENVLSAYRAVLYGLLPGTRDEVMKAPREVVGLVPKDLAIKHQFIPVSSDGKVLVLALAEPLSLEARREVQDRIHQDIAYRIVTPVRLAAGLAHHYGGDLDPKVRRLVEKLRNRAPGIVPYVAPPPLGGRVAVPTPVVGTPKQPKDERTEPGARAMDDGERTSPGSRRPRPKGQWGPLTPREAAKRLETCADRDEVIDLFLAFSKQFLEYAAIFVVQGDLASGKEAVGDGIGEERLRGLAVPLDVPGIFADVRDSRLPVVADFTKTDLDRIVVADLERERAQPALLVPVILRRRVVMFLYGDRAGEAFTLASVPEVVGLALRVAEALERIIVTKKGRASEAGIPAPANEATEPSGPGVTGTVGDGDGPGRPAPRRSLPFSSFRPPEPGPHGVLGVPRSAPPPPRRSATPATGLPQPEGVAPEAPRQAAPAPGGGASPSRPPSTAGGYVLRGAVDEVVVKRPSEAPRRTPSTMPPPGEAAPGSAARPTGARSAPPPSEATSTEGTEGAGARGGGKATDARPSKAPRPASVRPGSLRPDPRREGEGPVHSDRVRMSEAQAGLKAPTDTPEEATEPDGKIRRTSWRPDSKPPHRTAPRSKESEPNVIVNMGEPLELLVDELAAVGPDDEGAVVARIVKTGEAVLPVLVQRFPGPLWFDRRQPHVKVPRGRDISAIARAIVAFQDVAIPYIASLLDTRDSEARFYAAMLAGEFLHVDVVTRLVGLVYDRDPGTRRLAVEAVRAHKGAMKPVEEALKKVRVAAKHAKGDPETQLLSVMALGELRDRRALFDLVELLGASEPRLAHAAHAALVQITRQDFGVSLKRWQQWYEKNHERHRVEWLMDALLHSNEEIRQAAGDELKEITGLTFGFAALSSRRDREAAMQKYRDWWNREGYRSHR